MSELFDYRRLRLIPTVFLGLLAAVLKLASYLLPRATAGAGANRDAMTRVLQHRVRLRNLRDRRSVFVPPQ